MTRRILLLSAIPPLLRADDEQDIWQLLTDAASALSEGNPQAFLAAFDRSMEGYQTLETNVSALLAQNQVQSSIELLGEEGSGGSRTLTLDWFLQIVEQQDAAALTRRREQVHCKVTKQGRKWRITSLEPLSFFAPPRPQ